MKKILILLLTIIITAILTFLLIYYNLKITNVENGNITIDILGLTQVYYYEK